MPVELEMPELAESVIEGEIVKWLAKEGEHVHRDQPLVEVMTDKVTVEVPSPYEGTLLKQVAKEGEVVPIGKPIAIFGKEGETLEAAAEPPSEKVTPLAQPVDSVAPAAPSADNSAPPPQAVDKTAPTPQSADKTALTPQPADKTAPTPQPADKTAPAAQPTDVADRASRGPNGQPPARPAGGRVLATPAVRKLARELRVDLRTIHGSGPGGRVRAEDVKAASSKPAARPAAAAAPTAAPSAAAPSAAGQRVPLRGLRRVIADHMVASKHAAAHTLHVDEVDLTDLVALREGAKKTAAERGIKLTYLPFFVKAVCAALKKFPYMNASLDEAKHEIVLKADYNIGIATNTDNGLVVPVIHHADRMKILELAGAISQLAEKARAGKLSHDEISGGTFTITNVGSVGGLFTFPIINYPEVGILGTHAIVPRPVVRDGQIVVRQMMYLSISFDHRVVDGALAAQFVKEVAALLSSPLLLLMEEV